MNEHIALVPTFHETEVDSYFSTFECVGTALHCPLEYCKMCNKVSKTKLRKPRNNLYHDTA